MIDVVVDLWPYAVTGVLGLGLGVLAGVVLGRATARGATTVAPAAPAPPPVAPAPPAPAPVIPAPARAVPADARTDHLVRGLITAHDLAVQFRATSVETHVTTVLVRAGVRQLTATARETFDATVHEAVGAEPGGAGGHGPVVLRQVRPGWADDHAVLRPVQVVVAR
ncbi:nucleotide exchange factor GrpE [Actinoplanes sp. NPDC051470]|uniref:nucleotide exchange factor GrpE n=1 Tax=Actinoplanes sp. NPDC051470 TaxID=3157224 RepID=UPI003415D5B0